MRFRFSLIISLAAPAFVNALQAQTLTELKLQSPLDETRGWCVDLFAHLTDGLPIGGFQGHNCFSYMGNGVTEDQGFDLEQIQNEGKIRIVYFDRCMTLNEPNAGSFVAAEPCDGGAAQQFEIQADGRIVPGNAPELCLTVGTDSVPGGGGEPIHLIRRLSFETCSEEAAERQQWEFRTRFDGYDSPVYERPYD
ncbi:MAG TPA: RICIN domain-containing protein [Gammaproteobacteria bacterium]